MSVCAIAVAAAAQDAPEPGSSARRRTLPARVTALETGELPEDPSAFTTAIDTRDFGGEHKSAEDLLSRSVGVQVRRFGSPGQRSELSIRGSTGAQVVVLLDGVRLNSAQSGTVDLSTVPLDLIERIEVSRGGGAIRSGSDAVGGVVNLVTRRAGAEPRLAARFTAGSFGSFDGSLSYSGRHGDRELVLGYQGFRSRGDFDFRSAVFQGTVGASAPSRKLRRMNNASESHAGTLRMSRSFSDGVRVDFSNHIFFVSRGQPGLDTGAEGAGGQSPRAHERRLRGVSDVRVSRETAWGRVEARGFYRQERSRFRDPMPALGAPIDGRNRNSSGGLRLGAELERESWGAGHAASLQLELRRDRLRGNEFADQGRRVFGASLQDEISFWGGRLSLIPGLRFDRSGGFGSEWLPRLGWILSPRPWIRIKGNLEQSYRIPNFDELFFPNKGFLRGNPGLRPERARGADIGLELAVARWGRVRDARLAVSAFTREIRNSIVFQRVSPFTVQPTNTGDARIRGLELAASFEYWGWLALSGNWTRIDARTLRASVSSVLAQPSGALPGRPENELSLRLRVGPPSGAVKLVLERHHTSEIPTSFSGSSRVSRRTVHDASLGIDLVRLGWPLPGPRPGALLASLAITNLADRSARDAIGFPQPGRTLSFELAGRW